MVIYDMNAQLQLPLFEESIEEELFRVFEELKISTEKVRKGQFAKISFLTKRCAELENRLEIIERGLCKNE